MSARKKKQAMSDEEIRKFFEELPPPNWQEIQAWRKLLRDLTRQEALMQIARAMPEGSASSDSVPWALFATFLPNDGQESALARLMVAATNTGMECYARANSDAPEIRDLELNYAIRLSLTAAMLSKAFDHHRASKKEDFIDDTLKSPPKKASEPPQDQSSEQKPKVPAKEKD
jgi:hypothetical protein